MTNELLIGFGAAVSFIALAGSYLLVRGQLALAPARLPNGEVHSTVRPVGVGVGSLSSSDFIGVRSQESGRTAH